MTSPKMRRLSTFIFARRRKKFGAFVDWLQAKTCFKFPLGQKALITPNFTPNINT
jgi:hypothetical protein